MTDRKVCNCVFYVFVERTRRAKERSTVEHLGKTHVDQKRKVNK